LHIVFLACNKNPSLYYSDPSYIYRCENLGFALQQQGHKVEFCHLKLFSLTSRPDVVVFHRPRLTLRLRLLLLWLKFKKVAVVAEFDDLVFDVEYAEFSPGVLNNVLSLKKTSQNYLSQQEALGLFDAFTVSTVSLREHLLALHPDKKSSVLPNAIHHTWRINENAAIPAIDWNCPIITYLPGTRSHDRDFQVFAKGIARFLNDHSHVRLQVTGPLKFDLPVKPEQIIRREKVPFSEYHEHVRYAWVNLSPLEYTPFTRCKSALKVMEAGYWGKPTLCSPMPDTERFIGNGAIPVNSSTELYNELTKLLDPVHYQAYVKNLRQRVLKLSDINQVANQFSDLL